MRIVEDLTKLQNLSCGFIALKDGFCCYLLWGIVLNYWGTVI
ncbi:MAG: hypothetical protein V4581_16440 [Bacteroidota bacterium]